MKAKSFTYITREKPRQLITVVKIHSKYAKQYNDINKPWRALWDTGATNSCISSNVVDYLNLEVNDSASIQTAGGIYHTKQYLIDVELTNGVVIEDVPMFNAELDGYDMLIGMDIICQGDFSITSSNSLTKFSFRIPHKKHVDYSIDEKKAALKL